MPRFVLYRAAEKGGTLTLAYLDNSATTRVCEEAAQEILYTLTEGYGNPSSLHAKGFEAEREPVAWNDKPFGKYLSDHEALCAFLRLED